jgi:hypothetical protein
MARIRRRGGEKMVQISVRIWIPEVVDRQLRMLATLDRQPIGQLVERGIYWVVRKWASNEWPGFLDGSVDIPMAGKRFKEIPRGIPLRPRGKSGPHPRHEVPLPAPPLPPEPLYRQRKRETRRLAETYKSGEIID